MKLAACYCFFQREVGDPWEEGIAISSAHGGTDVVAIFPDDATTNADIAREVWEYRLDWTHSLYPPR